MIKSFKKYITESKKVKGVVYHGSGSRFSKFEQSKARIPNDFYGGGIAYFTDNIGVAITYAKSMAKKTKGDPIVYTVELNLNKVFDVDDKFSGKDLVSVLPNDVEEFARGAGLLGLNSDKFKTISDLKRGNMTLTGDRVFRGLSKGMNQTAAARSHLIDKGYDGLRYNIIGTKHSAYLAYNANSIQIKKRQMVSKKK